MKNQIKFIFLLTLLLFLNPTYLRAQETVKCGFGDVLRGKIKYVPLSAIKSAFTYHTDHFTINYDTTGYDSVSTRDLNGNSVPDLVEVAGYHAEKAWKLMIDTIGFHPPYLYDGSFVTDYPITLKKLTSEYGLTFFNTNEDIPSVPGYNYESYIELNISYQFADHLSDDPWKRDSMGIAVTISHEFFHAVQLGYHIRLIDGENNDLWWIEASAVFFEEQCTSEINDYFEYVKKLYNATSYPVYSTGIKIYGEVIYPLILKEWYGQKFIKDIWENIYNYNAVQAIGRYLEDRGKAWTDLLAEGAKWLMTAGNDEVVSPYYEDIPSWYPFDGYGSVYPNGDEYNLDHIYFNHYSINFVKCEGFSGEKVWIYPQLQEGLESRYYDEEKHAVVKLGNEPVVTVADTAVHMALINESEDIAYLNRLKIIPVDETVDKKPSVYPNPLKFAEHNWLVVQADSPLKEIKIFSVTGEVLYYEKLNNDDNYRMIKLSELRKVLAGGVYVYRIISAETITGKLFVIP